MLNSLPYVSKSVPRLFFRSKAVSEPRDDNDVEDGDCLGVSKGDAETEFDEDEGPES